MEHKAGTYYLRNTITYIIFVAAVALIILPLAWVVGNSLRINAEIGKYTNLSIMTFIPEKVTFENYITLFRDYPFARYIINTLFVAITVTGVSLLLNTLGAYAFAKIDFFGRDTIFSILLVTMIVPGEVLLLPSYMLIRRMGLADNYMALILPAAAGTFGIFFLRQFFLGTPRELEEAASIDGSSRIGTLFRILMPLAKPHLITLGLMTFMGQWDGFIWPLTVLTTPSKYLIQVGINYLTGEHFTEWGAIFAGTIFCSLPVIIIFLFLQRYYIQGITSIGIKG